MKKPKDTKSERPAEPSQDKAPLVAKKDAAEPGVIGQTEVGAGDGADAKPKGTQIKPVESTLLGDKTDQNPPAARKPDTGKADTGKAASDKSKPGAAKPETAKADMAAKKTPTDTAPRTAASEAPASATVSTQKAPVRKTGFWPVFLGGVVAAGLGSAATIWALPNLPAGWRPEQPAVEPAAQQVDPDAIRSDAVAAAQAAASEQIEALRADLAASEEDAGQQSPPGPSAEDFDALRQQVENQASRIEEIGNAASADDLASLRQQVESQASQIEELSNQPHLDPELASRVQSLANQADTLEQQIQTAAQAAQAKINAAQAEAEKLQQAAAESTRRAEAVAAVAALQAGLNRGVTPDQARQTLEGAGLETPEVLTRQVPGLDSLQADFPDAARGALRVALRQDSASGNGNLITNFLRAQTGARSVQPREGTDPDAILSRAGDDVQAGRIADAVTEIEALPEAARTAPAMAEWLSGATAYRDAQAALSDLSAPSN